MLKSIGHSFSVLVKFLSFIFSSLSHYHSIIGLPATLVTFFLSTLHAGAVFALIFPSVGVPYAKGIAVANNTDSMSLWQP